MKKRSFFMLLLLVSSITCISQKFAPIGATWHYSYSPWNEPSRIEAVKLESIKDTIIQEVSCRKIFGQGNNYIYSVGNKIFLFDKSRYTFVKIYDFDLLAGDTLSFRYGWDSVYSGYIVDSIAYKSINSIVKKVQYISPLVLFYVANSWIFFGNNIEGIGNTAFLFPQYSAMDPLIASGLRCYEDTVIGYYNTGLVSNCDSTVLLGINENEPDFINIYPNPANNYITFNTSMYKDFKLRIFNSIGQTILQKHFTSAINTINIQHFKQGIYYYNLINDKGKIMSGK
ncbi:MAG: T9SS type A sorting domain-containing protein, partial [bacterium]|nr:T9SS type A sorting domain-containing protein [bacterium]